MEGQRSYHLVDETAKHNARSKPLYTGLPGRAQRPSRGRKRWGLEEEEEGRGLNSETRGCGLVRVVKHRHALV